MKLDIALKQKKVRTKGKQLGGVCGERMSCVNGNERTCLIASRDMIAVVRLEKVGMKCKDRRSKNDSQDVVLAV